MATQALTGVLLIVLPVGYNAPYMRLARFLDYPDILRHPTSEVLERFTSGGNRLILSWWAFPMTAVLLAPTAVLVSATFGDANTTLLSMATTMGILAASDQFLGLIGGPSPCLTCPRTGRP